MAADGDTVSAAWSDEERAGDDDHERFHCPYPDCKRSFAELWRLKVHYRAPPDIRGSGKERGHSMELTSCPKCHKELKPGKHHTGCRSSSRTGASQAKRTKQARAKRAAAELAYENALRANQANQSGTRTRSVGAEQMQSSFRDVDLQCMPDGSRRSSAPAQVGRALDEAIERAVPALQGRSPEPNCAPASATIPAYGSAGRSSEGIGFQRVGRKHALDCTPSQETGRAPRDQHGSALHKLGKVGSGAFEEPRHLRNQRAAPAVPKIPIQTSLSRERFKRSNAWLKAFSDAAAGGGSWNGSEGRVSMTRDLDGPHCDDPATNQRFLSCPLPATDCFDAPLHPMDNVPYALMPNQPQHTTQHSPPGFQQPPQGPTQSNLPLRNLGLGSAFANASRQQQPWNGPAEMGPSVKPDPGPFNPFVEHTREGQPFVGQPAEQEGQLPLGAQWSHPFRQMSLMASLVSLPSLPDAGLGASSPNNSTIQDWAPGSITNPFASARIPELPLDRDMQLPPHQELEQGSRMLPQNPTPQQQMSLQHQLQQYAARSLSGHNMSDRRGSGERFRGYGIPQTTTIPRGPMPFGIPFNQVGCSMSSMTSVALDMPPGLASKGWNIEMAPVPPASGPAELRAEFEDAAILHHLPSNPSWA